MKSKRYYVIAEISNFIMILILYLSVTEIWNMLYKMPFNPVVPLGTLIMLLFALFMRVVFTRIKSFINNVFIYALLHLILVPVILFIPVNPTQKIVFFVLFMVIFVTDMRNYFMASGEGFVYVSVILVLVPALAYLFADIFGFGVSMTFFFIIGVAYVILYYIRLFFEDAYILSMERKNNDKMPFDDMLKNDSKLAIPFIAISFVVMVLARIDALDRLTLFLYLKFAAGFRFVLGKVLKFIGMVFDFLFGGETDDLVMMENFAEEEGAAPSPAFTWISNIIFFALAIVVLIVIIKIIISVVKALSVRKEVSTQTIEDEGMMEIREKIVRKRSDKKEKLSKVRRIYKKTIERYIKKGYDLKEYQTPRERSEDIKKLMNEDISVLNAMYEKERYGQFND